VTPGSAASLLHAGLVVALKIAAPPLGLMTLTAIIFGILQAATQVQDSTVSFTPKLVAALCVMWMLATWMTATLDAFMCQTLNAIPWIVMR
jgi:flagellar biosynthesis protein FliQ